MAFIISGKERKIVKMELAELRRFVKMFWFYEDVERVYGGGMEDSKCHELLEKAQQNIKMLEEKLQIEQEDQRSVAPKVQ